MLPLNQKKSKIWTIGGGKGGIGKSFLVSSIGSCLASKNKKVILVDADLGGANLHNFLGIRRPHAPLTDFFDKKIALADLIVDTGIPNMGLLTGAIGSLAPENIKHAQKIKFFRHIQELEADYVLIDLGAGTHFHTIDTFLLGDRLVAITVPEMIAIENVYHFLKNALFRKLIYALAQEGFKDIIVKTWREREKHNIANLKQLIQHLKGLSAQVKKIITHELSHFTIHLLLNKVKSSQDILIGNSVKSLCMKYFGLHAKYVGYVEHDDFITTCINKRLCYVQAYPASRSTEEIEKLTRNLLEDRHIGLAK